MEFVNLGSHRRAAIGGGIFLLIGIGIVVLWAVTSFTGIAGRTAYYTHLQNVSGLRTGANVEIAGYRIGSVAAIEPVFAAAGGPRFQVELSLQSQWRLPGDTTVTLSRPNPVAAPIIALQLGGSPSVLEPGAVIATAEAAGLEGEISGLLGTVTRLVEDQVTPLLTNLNAATTGISAHLEDNLPPILYDARLLVSRIERVVARVDGVVLQVQADLGAIGTRLTDAVDAIEIERINATMTTLNDAADSITGVLAAAETLLANADQVVVGTGKLIEETGPDMQTLAGDARYAIQTASPRLNTILLNLERATEDLAGLLAELRANPAVLIGVEGAERRPAR